MNLLKYFNFYYKLTRGKFITFILLIFASAIFELFAGAIFMAVLEFSSEKRGNNILTRHIYSLISSLNLPSQPYELFAMLALCSISFAFGACILIFSNWFSAKLEASIFIELQDEILKRLFSSKYEFFTSNNIGNLNNIVVHQMFKVSSSFKSYANILTNLTLAIAYLVYPLIINPLLPILMLIMALPLLFVFKLINEKTKHYSIRNTEELSKLYGIIYQLLAHFKYLKATANSDRILERLWSQNLGLTHVLRWQSLWGAISSDGFRPVIFAEISLIVFYMAVFQSYNITEVMILMGFLYMSYQKVISIQGAYQSFLVSSGSILVYQKFRQELDDNNEQNCISGTSDPEFSGPITFEDVSFKFETMEENVLNGVNLTIKPNTTVAFVGGSGAGKSTIVNLVCGLLFPHKGRICLSGKDYKSLDIVKLRASIGYVTQEPVIFNDSVSNNITMWDDSKVGCLESVSKRASADEFIQELPQKYETLLGDNGINISGGQRQRITITRELARNTPILIFDEATSALDTETERKIQKSIDDSHGEKTIIIIAHRLSTIRNADQIFVLEKGSIVEHGGYDELIGNNGKFRQMVNSQSLN